MKFFILYLDREITTPNSGIALLCCDNRALEFSVLDFCRWSALQILANAMKEDAAANIVAATYKYILADDNVWNDKSID